MYENKVTYPDATRWPEFHRSLVYTGEKDAEN